jgi:protein-S-isoprenylcysteine O-methyltransferase Ste14
MDDLSAFAYGMWPAVIFNVVFVLAFAFSFLTPRRPVEWRSLGLLAAWVVALFTEMYGLPLTIYALTALLGQAYPVANPFSHENGHLLVVFLAGGSPGLVLLVDSVTSLGFFVGFALMARAWQEIHQAKGELVADGLYARVRHPQYTGLFLIIVSLLVQWPTLPSLLMAPALLVTYIRLARREERDMIARFGERYTLYMKQVPAFVPRLWVNLRGTDPSLSAKTPGADDATLHHTAN